MPDGYQFDAQSIRRIEAAVQAVERMTRGGLLPGLLNLGGLPPGLVPFIPDSDVPAGGVMIAAEAIIDGERVVILKTRKSQVTGERPICVAEAEPVSTDGYGFCWPPTAAEPAQVAYDDADGTQAAGEVWGPIKDSFKIRKGIPGFKILAAGESGLAWATYDGVAEPSMTVKVNAGQTLSPGGSAVCSIYRKSGGTWVDTTIDETVYAPAGLSTGSIVAAKFVCAIWTPQSQQLEPRWAAEC